MPKKKGDFLDPGQPHILTEQECELISFFRTFSKTKREAIARLLFTIALDDHAKKHEHQEEE